MKSELDRDRPHYKNIHIYYKSIIYSILYSVTKRERLKKKHHYFKSP